MECRGLCRLWMRFADGAEGTADFGDFAGRGMFCQWEGPGVWEGMRMSHGAVVWGPDDPSTVLGFLIPACCIRACRGSAGKRMWSPGFARLSLERLRVQRMSEGLSDS